MKCEISTLKKSQIIESIPCTYCAHVLKVLNVRNSPSIFTKSDHEIKRILSQKITQKEAIYLYRQWERGFPPECAAKYLKKPDGIAISVLVSMNLRKKGFSVETEVLLNGRQCDIVALKGNTSADEIWAIELKSPRDVWQRGINQCKAYSSWSDKPLLAIMGLTKEPLMEKTVESCIGIALLDSTGDFEIVKEPAGEFQCTNQSFEIFTVRELKKIIRFTVGRCPNYKKGELIDYLFQSKDNEKLEMAFRTFFLEKVRTPSLFNLTSVESDVLAAYLMRTAFKEVREAGGMMHYLTEYYQNQYEIEELILSELIHRGVLPTLKGISPI